MGKIKVKSMSELKNKLNSRMKFATQVAYDNAYEILQHNAETYYEEYKPHYYKRTFQLFDKSIFELGVYGDNGNGCLWLGTIMFDSSKMNHKKKLTKDGKDWSLPEEVILENAFINHNHGGVINPSGENTAIWEKSIEQFHGDKMTNLAEILIDNLDIKGEWA